MSLAHFSPWSRPIATLPQQGQVWHARQYAKWLLSAGAEPRFGLLLSSGPLAEARWAQLLQEQGVQLERCAITEARPLPEPLTRHRGDHFNRKLFLLEGLDELSVQARREALEVLNGQRSQLKQTATWVTLLIRSPESLEALCAHAPHAYALLERRSLMWEVSERPQQQAEVSVTEPPQAPLPSWSAPLERLYVSLTRPAKPVSELTFDRAVRAGVMSPPPGAHPSWEERAALWRGDVGFGGRARRSSGAGVVEPLSEVSEGLAWLALTRRAEALSAGVRVQLEAQLSPLEGWLLGASSAEALEPALHPWASLAERLTQGEPPSEAELATLNTSWEALNVSADELGARAYLCLQGALWLAESAALSGDIEGCTASLERAYQRAQLPLELRFVAGEKLVELYTLTQQRAEAQATLKALFSWAIELGAPLYEARALIAKASHLGALDPSRGDAERQEAARLGKLHGAPDSP